MLNLTVKTKLENLSSGTHAMFIRDYACLSAVHFESIGVLLVPGHPAPVNLATLDVPGIYVNKSHYVT